MIVRIQGEGQYELDSGTRAKLDRLDSGLFQAIGAGDAAGFVAALTAVADYVESNGSRVADERLVPSDFILPARDTTLDEAKRLLTDEGYLKPVEA